MLVGNFGDAAVRWPEKLAALGLVTVWLLLPAHANASAGMAMGPAAPDVDGVGGARHSWATERPRCMSCHLAPPPVVKTPSEPDRQAKAAHWLGTAAADLPAEGWYVLQARAEAVPLRIAHCRWRD